jgi:hypothetical protein
MTDFSIVPPHLAVRSMRDNGYKNMAYALAELVDNSIQAGARSVEVLLAERYELVTQREKRRIYQIGVLDNGCGMDARVLRMALQFGNGTRLEEAQRTGMGKFGMGLPSASISQCRKVEVWSWQHGINEALYTYLDLDEIEGQRMHEIPLPQAIAVPKIWVDMSTQIGPSGTLVVWSSIDRGNWVTSKAIIENSEFVIGRMYRHFLVGGAVAIRMCSFNVSINRSGVVHYQHHADFETMDYQVRPNDPLHLIPYTSPRLVAEWGNRPIFEPFGDFAQKTIPIMDEYGTYHDVHIYTAIALPEARNQRDLAGSQAHGRHVAKNVGISIVRAMRELELDVGQVRQHDPVERWWSMEIQFPPALDNVFGVTNNKQAAVHLRELLAMKDDELPSELGHLKPLYMYVKSALNRAREELKKQTSGIRSQQTETKTSEIIGTKVIETRVQSGHESRSDVSAQTTPPAQRIQSMIEDLTRHGMAPTQAEQVATHTITEGRRVQINCELVDSSGMFSVRDVSGVLQVTLNIRHPMHTYLYDILEAGSSPYSDRERLARARVALEVLLIAWARLEDESAGNAQKARTLLRIREEWGDMAHAFFEQMDENA